jgi:hypothetical protein
VKEYKYDKQIKEEMTMGILLTIVDIVIAYYIYLDAQKRGLKASQWFALALLFTAIVWIVYAAKASKAPKQDEAVINKYPPGFRSHTSWKMCEATVGYIIFIIFFTVAWNGALKNDNNQEATTTSTPAYVSKTVASDPSTDNAGKNTDSAAKQQEAEKNIASFTEVQKSFGYVLTSYGDELAGIGNGSIDPVTGYSDLEKLDQQAMNVHIQAAELDVDKPYSDDKETLLITVSYLENSIREAKSYMDNQKISQLADAKNDLQMAINGNNLLSTTVIQHAVANGYSPK